MHLLSPTQIHQVDAASTFKIRRSLSRSPSKASAFRLVTSKSTSPSPSSPLSPSCLSPPNRSASTPFILHTTSVTTPSTLAVPYRISTSRPRATARKLSPKRTSPQRASRQRSPGKRTLSEASDQGNSVPRSSAGSSSDDVENQIAKETSPTTPFPSSASNGSHFREDDNSLSPFRAFPPNVSLNGPPAKSSPLKRSDGIMNLDQASVGNPSAKRRSLHGASFGADFDIFDYEAALQGGKEIQKFETNSSSDSMASQDSASSFSPLPKRTSSLRRTTLQQRHDKPAFSRSRLNVDHAQDAVTPGQTTTKSKFRQSLGNIMPSRNRESPFSFQGNLPSASAHPMSQHNSQSSGQGDQIRPHAHPLSRTLTQCSSNSSLAEDSPTHLPVRHPAPRRPLIEFSKSLPVVQKPRTDGITGSNQCSQASWNEHTLATPENYRLARPHPAAFASTGLISKRHKNVDDTQPNFNATKSLMPDTPCKRHSLMEAPTSTAAPSARSDEKDRRVRHSFGTPSTPFNPHASKPEPGAFGKGVSVFGSNILRGNQQRRGSFLSVEGEENSQSPVGKGDSQSSTDFELPPTPTKQTLASGSLRQANFGRNPFGQFSSTNGGAASTLPNIGSSLSDQACKSISVASPSGIVDEDSDNTVEISPSVALRFRNSFSMPSSFTRSRRLTGNFKSPTPLNRVSYTLPFLSSKRTGAKQSPLSPASPINDLFERFSPHTPRDFVIPPDPSRLSISAYGDSGAQPMEGVTSSAVMVPPATPTMMRESFPQFSLSHASMTPLKNLHPADIDQALIGRFDKVEIVGSGEFSQVYRCSKAPEAKGYFSAQNSRISPRKPLPDRVWAVKKSRKAFIGQRDRERKLQEVQILRSMPLSDHVLQLCDSWEEKGYLYIQTEFCEEGTLDIFLVQEGRKGRLDDFRIWKIMSELALV